jgi:hypothetical protein
MPYNEFDLPSRYDSMITTDLQDNGAVYPMKDTQFVRREKAGMIVAREAGVFIFRREFNQLMKELRVGIQVQSL